MWGSYYKIPKAIFYLLKAGYIRYDEVFRMASRGSARSCEEVVVISILMAKY